jgi:hypothetical protein
MSAAPIVFSATGTIQTYPVSTSGTFVIEAAGGQGGAGASPGGKGARVSGMFYLKRGDLLKIVAGSQGTPAVPPHQPRGSGGGSSMVWTGSSDLPSPIKLMLSARGGKGGSAAGGSDSGEAVPDAAGIVANRGPLDATTADALTTQWTRAAEPAGSRSASSSGHVDRCGYNAGGFRTGTPDVQEGDGYVSITPIAVPASAGPTAQAPTDPAPPANDAAKSSAPPSDSDGDAPSQTMLPQVTPRVRAWEKLLRRHRRP